MIAVDLAIAALAAAQIVDIWLNGSIFQDVQNRLYRIKSGDRWSAGPSELLTCPFCLTPWACLGCMAVLLAWGETSAYRLPVYMFAATRIAHLTNGILSNLSEPEVVDRTEETENLTPIDD